MNGTSASPARDLSVEAPSTIEPAPRLSLDDLLGTLDPERAAAVRKAMRSHRLPEGETIIEEGARTDAFFLIEDGSVEVFRTSATGEERSLTTLSAGAIVGEMALLDNEPRSASARTLTESSLLELKPSDLSALPGGEQILAAVRGSLAAIVTKRMRTQTDKYVVAMERELAAVRERQHFGRFFIYVLAMMTMGLLVNDFLADGFLKVNIFTPTFAWIYLLIVLVPTTFVIHRMKIPLRDLGITTIGMKRSIIEGLVFSAALMAVAFGLAWVLRVAGIHEGTPVPAAFWGTTGYFFHSAFQEVIARGLLQSSFQRFLDDRRGLQSVLLSSALFGVFHIHFGLAAVTVTILSGFLFGAVYLRHQNLAGVTILHFFAGGAAFWTGLL